MSLVHRYLACDHEHAPGCVYFVRAETGPVKIGYTSGRAWYRHALHRLSSLQSYSPVELRLLAFLPGSQEDERRLHRVFKRDRLHGEWFSLSDDLADLISALTDREFFPDAWALEDWRSSPAMLAEQRRVAEIVAAKFLTGHAA